MEFSHIALNCRDIDATERFYTEHFGFVRARNVPLGNGARITFVRHGSMLLELFAAEGDRPDGEGDGPHAAGIRHFAFQVESVEAFLEKLAGAAPISVGPLDFSDFIPGWRTVWLKDPDGNVVEVSQGYKDEQVG
jgi:glyoxylase I family protein